MIRYYDWLPDIQAVKGIASIPNELALFTYSDIDKTEDMLKMLKAPHKVDFFLMVFHFAGSAKVSIDMVEHNLSAAPACNVIHIVPGQIVTGESFSEDFDAHIIITSRRFVENLLVYINDSIALRPGKKIGIIEKMDSSSILQVEHFIGALKQIISNENNPYRIKVVQHIIMALFYSSEKLREMNDSEVNRSSADYLSRRFLELVKDNFRSERQLQFYADQMCITPRYLSRVVKDCTGSSAADWIERYVVLEACALLKSTTMTVQQISDELNFPSQTFFGKYFKRRTNMSPKEYRRVG